MPLTRNEIAGRYRILRPLGSGGTGTVYLAYDEILEKEWAMKIVPRVSVGAGDEILMLKKLSHPRLPRIVDVIGDSDSVYIVMDYVEGPTLTQLVAKRGRVPERLVVTWGIMLAGVLSYLAGQPTPVVYRDMKPDNIILRDDGEVVLLDLGSAGISGAADAVQKGTLGYAAPEQFGVHGRSDPRSDIYGLGMTMAALVRGETSTDENPIRYLERLDPPVSENLLQVLKTATRKRPSSRYQSAEDLRDALLAVQDGAKAGIAVRRRQGILAVAFVLAGTVCLMTGAASRQTILAEMGSEYSSLMLTASQHAAENPERSLSACTTAMGLMPFREEAYLQYLSIMEKEGRGEEGILNVSARLSQLGEAKLRSGEVVYRMALLLFEGNPQSGVRQDYRRAAALFQLVDPERYPEAVYYSTLALTLSGFGEERDYVCLDETLERFASDCRTQKDRVRAAENRIMMAGVYMAYSRGFEEKGIPGFERAATLLKETIIGLESSGTGSWQEEALLRKARLDLAVVSVECDGNESCYDPALAVSLYDALLADAGDQSEIRDLRFRMAAALELTEDPEAVKAWYRILVKAYPEAETCFRYSLWLLDTGNVSGAKAWFDKGSEMEGAEDRVDREILEKRLKGAADES